MTEELETSMRLLILVLASGVVCSNVMLCKHRFISTAAYQVLAASGYGTTNWPNPATCYLNHW